MPRQKDNSSDDNFNTHVASAFYEPLNQKKLKTLGKILNYRYSKHGSRLNIAEIELHVLNG